METLPKILDAMRASLDAMRASSDAMRASAESMQLSLIVIAAFVAFGFIVTTIMLFRQGKMLREIHALCAQTTAVLENVSRLVVHAGGRK